MLLTLPDEILIKLINNFLSFDEIKKLLRVNKYLNYLIYNNYNGELYYHDDIFRHYKFTNAKLIKKEKRIQQILETDEEYDKYWNEVKKSEKIKKEKKYSQAHDYLEVVNVLDEKMIKKEEKNKKKKNIYLIYTSHFSHLGFENVKSIELLDIKTEDIIIEQEYLFTLYIKNSVVKNLQIPNKINYLKFENLRFSDIENRINEEDKIEKILKNKKINKIEIDNHVRASSLNKVCIKKITIISNIIYDEEITIPIIDLKNNVCDFNKKKIYSIKSHLMLDFINYKNLYFLELNLINYEGVRYINNDSIKVMKLNFHSKGFRGLRFDGYKDFAIKGKNLTFLHIFSVDSYKFKLTTPNLYHLNIYGEGILDYENILATTLFGTNTGSPEKPKYPKNLESKETFLSPFPKLNSLDISGNAYYIDFLWGENFPQLEYLKHRNNTVTNDYMNDIIHKKKFTKLLKIRNNISRSFSDYNEFLCAENAILHNGINT